MSIDTEVDADAAAGTEDADALAARFGEAIADLPAYRRFEEAKAAVQADDEAQDRISEFEQLRQEFAIARQAGKADEESMRKVQEAQQELHSLDVMKEYVDAQDDLQARLELLNQTISDRLVVDFGGEAGGCCKD